ncbi:MULTISPECIES: ParA family protein [Kordiimonas]|jgi:cellulose biosynthesis protein BcsQ|uniref:ParA family protein n=1 Tax=Kordiimonas TaxID=288021 RepID=UPI00257C1070|nr:ParA family protein [Kordiimonas sp. UBA4487]
MSEEANSPGQQKDNAQKAPLIVSVASGKGGVGKTRISLGLACDFARSFKTLIVDLDFFNRGMTGLLPKGRHVRWIDGPAFMAEEGVPEQWQLVQAQEDATEAENIYFLRYPDLTETQTMAFVSNSIATLEESLSNMFGTLAKEFGIEVIVLDCHGGPDNTSFAANGLANFSILVTDTDKASLHGTFNFVRQLEYVEGKPPQRTHIVFNRIPEDSNFRVLETMHDRYFRPRLGNQSKLLAAFPADRQVARASDKASLFPLLIPNSLWARKIRTLIFDLLAGTEFEGYAERLNLRNIPIVSEFRRQAMYNVPWFLQPERVLKLASIFAVVMMFLILGIQFAQQTWPDESRETLAILDETLVFSTIWGVPLGLTSWLISSLWISGTINTKAKITSASRRGKYLVVTYNMIKIFMIWIVPAIGLGVFILFLDELSQNGMDEFEFLYGVTFSGVLALSYVGYLLKGLYEILRTHLERFPARERVLTLVAVSIYMLYAVIGIGIITSID